MRAETKKEQVLWRKVQVSKCIRVILIFMGILLMQLAAYMLCVLGYVLFHVQEGKSAARLALELNNYMTESGSSLLIWVSALSALLCLVWCGILYRKSEWRQPDFSYRRALSAKRMLGAAGIGFGGCIVLSFLLGILISLFPGAFASYRRLMSGLDMENSLITVVYVLLIGPVSEEVIFRGAIMDRLKIAFPFWLANLLQAALFGLYHMNFVQGAYAFCLGLALGLVGEVTGSVLAAILTHVVFNTTSQLAGMIPATGTGFDTAVSIAAFLLALAALKKSLKYYLAERKKQAAHTGIPRGDMVE